MVLQLSHTCENKDKDGKDCLKYLSSDHIQLKVRTAFDRGVTAIDQNNLHESRKVEFFCSACGNTIRPKLKSRVGEVPENQRAKNIREVDFLHPVVLRNMLEELFEVDINYMKV